MSFWDVLEGAGRVVAGVYTGGLSEAAIRGGQAIANSGGGDSNVGSGELFGNPYSPDDVSNEFFYGRNADVAPALEARYGNKATQVAGNVPSLQTGDYRSALANTGTDRQAQASGLDYYHRMMMGQGPSVAQQQLYAGRDANINQAMAMAHSARGGASNVAAANYQAIQQGANATQQTAQQSAMLRAQEQQNAAAGYSGLATNMHAGDLSTGTLANQNAYQQAVLGQNATQMGMGYDQMAESIRQSELQSRMGYANMRNNFALGLGNNQTQLSIAQQQADASTRNALIGAAGQGLGALAQASDRELKTDIAEGSEDVRSALDNLKPYAYSYKDQETYGKGPRLGIMAQDLEKSRLGKEIVIKTPAGRLIDNNKSITLALAGLADMHSRMKKLESK